MNRFNKIIISVAFILPVFTFAADLRVGLALLIIALNNPMHNRLVIEPLIEVDNQPVIERPAVPLAEQRTHLYPKQRQSHYETKKRNQPHVPRSFDRYRK